MDATPGYTWESRGPLAACMRLLGGWGGVRPPGAERGSHSGRLAGGLRVKRDLCLPPPPSLPYR